MNKEEKAIVVREFCHAMEIEWAREYVLTPLGEVRIVDSCVVTARVTPEGNPELSVIDIDEAMFAIAHADKLMEAEPDMCTREAFDLGRQEFALSINH